MKCFMIKLDYVVHDELVKQETQRLFVGHGQKNILTTTIGKPDHSGRVCSIGGVIGLRDYYDLPQRSNESLSQKTLRKMKLQREKRINQHMVVMK